MGEGEQPAVYRKEPDKTQSAMLKSYKNIANLNTCSFFCTINMYN